MLNEKESVFYIILNFDNPSESINNRIAKHIDTIKGLFEYDKEYVKLQFGISEIHRYISGLKKQHIPRRTSRYLCSRSSTVLKNTVIHPRIKKCIFSARPTKQNCIII
ncbi:MAG: hypothetical protein L6V93_21785 [Clostridiales bacterium]|nr:MAG: hypothetical protein L6V93_21785 [Clostridiales bacterium]